MSLRFLYQASLMEKRYLEMQMRSCKDSLKGKTAHFRLPSTSQKRACLCSLLSCLCLSVYRSIRLFVCLNIRPKRLLKVVSNSSFFTKRFGLSPSSAYEMSEPRHICLSLCQSVCLSVCLFVCMKQSMSVCEFYIVQHPYSLILKYSVF